MSFDKFNFRIIYFNTSMKEDLKVNFIKIEITHWLIQNTANIFFFLHLIIYTILIRLSLNNHCHNLSTEVVEERCIKMETFLLNFTFLEKCINFVVARNVIFLILSWNWINLWSRIVIIRIKSINDNHRCWRIENNK